MIRNFLLGCFMLSLCLLLYLPVYKQANTSVAIVAGWSQEVSRDTQNYVQPGNTNTSIHHAENVCRKRHENTHTHENTHENTDDAENADDADGRLFLLIVVCSSSFNFKTRTAIRETWGNYTNYLSMKLTFDEIQKKYEGKLVRKESNGESDIVKRKTDNLGENSPRISSVTKEFTSTKNIHLNNIESNEYDGNIPISLSTTNFNEMSVEEKLPRFKIVFLLGVPNVANDKRVDVQNKIDEEAEKYGDIIQEDFIDSYNNLTIKSVLMLKWVVTHCSQTVRYIAKMDDDVFLNVVNLEHALEVARSTQPVTTAVKKEEEEEEEMLAGDLYCRVKPISDNKNKWYTPRYMYSGRTFPCYLSGSGYVFSEVTARALYQATLQTPLLYLEDIYITGMCAARAKPPVKPTEIVGFNVQWLRSRQRGRANPCALYTSITLHRLPPQDMKRLVEFYKDTNLVEKCKKLENSKKKKNKNKNCVKKKL